MTTADQWTVQTSVARGRFESQWEASHPDVPIQWDNIDFTPPEIPTTPNPPRGSYVRVVFVYSGAFQADMSSDPRFRSTGTMVVSVFVPKGVGEGLAYRLAETAAGIFRQARIDGMTFRAPYPVRVGPDGDYFQLNVVSPFFADATAGG